MAERPILFSAPMVRALLAGTKTQTRRVIKGDIAEAVDFMGGADGGDDEPGIDLRWGECHDDDGKAGKTQWIACCADYPEEGFIELGHGYGAVGDRLWVRETFAHIYTGNRIPDARRPDDVVYRADGHGIDAYAFGPWCPSIHMPRWASRITLDVTGVRVERLQAISEADAIAEGIETMTEHDRDMRPTGRLNGLVRYASEPPQWGRPREAFQALWTGINGAESWDANPWVWVIEFERTKEPV